MDYDYSESPDLTMEDIWLSHGNKTVTDGSYDLPDLDFAGISVTCFEEDKSSSIIYSLDKFLENPFSFSLPTVMVQIVLITTLTRIIYYILKPIKQPRVVCDLLAGILLSPNLLGRLKPSYIYAIFPQTELVINRSLAIFGLMLYLFLTAVKMDPKTPFKSTKKSLTYSLSSALIPLTLLSTSSFFLLPSIPSPIARGRFLVFLLSSLSLTPFPLLSDTLAELDLLNSHLGRLAMSISNLHTIFTIFFISLFVLFDQSQSPRLAPPLCAATSLILILCVVLFAIRPWVRSLARAGGRLGSAQLHAIVLCVVALGLGSEMAGASFAFGPLLMGIVVPDGPPVETELVERIGTVANEVLMPLMFLLAGEGVVPEGFVGLGKRKSWVGLMVLGFGGKLVGTMGPGLYFGLSVRKAFVLGLIMNFQGIVNMVDYMNFRNGSLLDRESYTILILGIIVTTSISTFLVKILYDPLSQDELVGRRGLQHLPVNAELRLLLCLLNDQHIPSALSLLDASSPAPQTPLCVYVLHLLELTGRANSTLISHRNKKGFINPSKMDRLHNAFINYEQDKGGVVAVQPFTAVAPFKNMHQDVCALAGDKNVAIVIVPLLGRKYASGSSGDQEQAFRTNNIPHILSKAPCSVGLLVHMGPTITILSTPSTPQHHIGLLFWGGPDDRESLSYAARMVRRPAVTLTVTRFLSTTSTTPIENEAKLDNELIEAFQNENSGNLCVQINEVIVNDTEQTIMAIRNFSRVGYDIIVVGRRLSWNSMLRDELEEWSEFPELGVVGDMIASSDFELEFLILVVQQRV